MRYNEAQYKLTEMRAMFRHAEIVSGAYKFRDKMVGIAPDEQSQKEAWALICRLGLLYSTTVDPFEKSFAGEEMPKEPLRWRNMTDEEKLKDSLDIMQRHIDFMQDCLDAWNLEST